MKNVIVSIFLITFIFGCSDSSITSPEVKSKFKKIAFDSLTEGQKETLTKTLDDATYLEGNYQSGNCPNMFVTKSKGEMCFMISNQEIQLFYNQKLIGILFNTTNDALLGPIIVIIDYKTEDIIGNVGRL